MKRTYLAILAAMVIAAPAGAWAADKVDQAAKVTPAVPTLTMPDGKAYTAEQIIAVVKEKDDRIAELTAERNQYLGIMVDLQTQLQKLKQTIALPAAPASTPTPAPAK